MSAKSPSLSAQIAEMQREIDLRVQVYPGQVARGRMRKAEAELRIGYAEAILQTLKWLQAHEADIRAAVRHAAEVQQLLGMAPEVRAAILSHWPEVAELAVERATQAAGAAS